MATPPKKTIRVVSFNVHFGKNTAEIAKVFAKDKKLSSADVILLQEIEFHQAEKICRAEIISRHLNFHFVYQAARELKKSGTHGLAILSRFPIAKSSLIKLPKYKIFFLLRARIALVASIKIAGVDMTVCNIHLDTRINPKNRMRQLNKCLLELKKTYDKNIIVGGDFNTIPFRTALSGFPIFYSNQAKYLKNHMAKMGFKYFSDPGSYTMKKSFLKMRLDHIFTDRLPIIASGVEKHIKVSDHLPLWADIEIT